MTRRHLTFVAAVLAASIGVLALPGAVCAQSAGLQSSPQDVADGALVFSRNCQRCHQPRGPEEWSDREWVIIIQHMETRANLTRKRADLVRAFLLASNGPAQAPGRTRAGLATPDTSAITTEMIAAGRRIYATSGGCIACHGSGLQGGPIAPNLADGKWRNGDGSYAAILEVIRNGVSGTAMAAYPGGIDDEMAQRVAAYVWSVSTSKAEP